jgi:hypothetical protein
MGCDGGPDSDSDDAVEGMTIQLLSGQTLKSTVAISVLSW